MAGERHGRGMGTACYVWIGLKSTYVCISLLVLFSNVFLGIHVGHFNQTFPLNSVLSISYPSDAWNTLHSYRFHQPKTTILWRLKAIHVYNPPSSITSSCAHSVTSVSILTFKSPRVFQSWVFVIKLGWAKPDHWVIRQITLVTDAGRCACWVPFGPRGHERLHRSPDHQGIVLQHGCFRGSWESCQTDPRFTLCIAVLSQNCTHVKRVPEISHQTKGAGSSGNNTKCLFWRTWDRASWYISIVNPIQCRSQWPRGLRRRSAVARLLRSWVRIPPGAWIFVCFECCVLSGRGLCDELITCPEESYRQW